MMDISFLNPAFLLLLLGIPALWFFPRKPDNTTQAVLRSVLFACVVLALARPVLMVADKALFQVLILDRSDSVSPDKQTQALAMATEWMRQVEDKEKSTVIVIEGSNANAEGAGKDQSINPLLTEAGTVVRVGQSLSAGSSSSLSAALAAAQRQIPEGSPGVITLLSDGLSTDLRWGPTVQTLIGRGITVNTADLGRDETDIYPAGMKTEAVLRVGQTIHVEVPVIGKTSGVQVRLLDGQGTQLAISEPVNSTGRVVVPLEFEPRAEGFMKVRAEVMVAGGADSDATNNSFEKTLAIQSSIRMLYLGERIQHGADRLGELLGRGFEIKDGSEIDLDNSPPDLKNYDLVMVDDRSASLMPESFQADLSDAVSTRGLGLVFSGGKSSFGTGGYDETTISKVLPVEFTQHTEKRDPSTALALIIDTSQSMAGARIDLAKQVARLTVRRLKAHDRIGIVEFYGNKHWALPMQSAANKISIDRAIGRMQAIGGTVLYPAIEEAYYGLKNVSARYKHIIIVTDAGVEENDYEGMLRRISKDRINVSTVLVGAQAHNQKLIDLANWGKGRFYSASNRYALPEVILKQPSTMKLPAYKTGAFTVNGRGGTGWWDRVDREALPALAGYVETKSRPGAEVLIEVQGNAHPVLTSWHYGLGRVTAFMTEPVGLGTTMWQNWRDYGRMLGRVANRTADDSQAFSFKIERSDNRALVTARRNNRAMHLFPQANVLDEQNGEREALQFKQVAPDYFMAELPADPTKELRVNAGIKNLGDGGQSLVKTRLVSGAAEDVNAEKQVDTATALDLAMLSSATAGNELDLTQPAEAVFVPEARDDKSALTLFKLWPYALLLALLIYLSELVYRRWPRT